MKTETTKKLEQQIKKYTSKMGVYGCFEVGIGFSGDKIENQRVDYMTYDTKGIWRCYEIKSSLSDFRSKSLITFIGHYNYYVMNNDLYEKVKDEIPDWVGVFCSGIIIKNPKKQELKIKEEILLKSMIKSLAYSISKYEDSTDPEIINKKNRIISRLEKEIKNNRENKTSYINELLMYKSIVRKLCVQYRINKSDLINEYEEKFFSD